MSTYVIGHRNPDSDAICSAIGYAHFLQLSGQRPEAMAARCGDVNARTQFALKEAGVALPKLVLDVRPVAEEIGKSPVISAHKDDPILDAFDLLRNHRVRSVPVVDQEECLVGFISLQKMLGLLLPREAGMEARRLKSSLERIAKVTQATFLHEDEIRSEEDLVVTVGAMSASTFEERLKEFEARSILLVTGNRPTIQRPAIEYGVRCLLITGGHRISDDLLARAKEKKVTVLTTPLDTASTTSLVKGGAPISSALENDTITFSPDDTLDELRDGVRDSTQHLFPIIDKSGRLLSVFSKSDLLSPPRTKVILVDHNEVGQAVNGISEAQVVEIVDHHRLGGSLVTSEPIRFYNEPLGSTCTIVACQFEQAGLKPSPEIALCLATGMISDTLNLTSPTTTDVDRKMLKWMEACSGRDLKQFAEEFFKTGSVLTTESPSAAISSDCKQYEESGWQFSVSQIEELGLERFSEKRDSLIEALEEYRKSERLDFSCLFVTDISIHNSVLLVAGEPKVAQNIDYPEIDEGGFLLEGVVSRKKQLLPYLSRLLPSIPK
ncbi:MAG: putative manganese-dependent inorganic diphosphatase [Verrucomicrobiota bacterium]